MSDTSSDPRALAATLPTLLSGVEPILITTSGSTGVPKTVVVSTAALRASATATAARIGEGAWLLALPVAYVAGLQVLVRAHLAGTRPVYLDGRFTPDAFVAAAHEMPVSASRYTSLVPAQLATVVSAAETEPGVRDALRSFEAILIGGQALPLPLRERADALGIRVVRTYGSTETSGGCVYDGVPLDGVDVRVMGGELVIAGPTLADGYLGDDALTTATFPVDPDGTRRYRTGDTGSVEDGVVRVTGRRDNVIVSGGVNVSLDRVEAVVRGVPGLEHAVVIGVPDERWGEASVIVLESIESADDAALLEAARAAVAEAIGPAARPARIARRAIPQLPSGKPDRTGMRQDLARE
ncbi:AMP-binding protein [Microbacterium lacus]|uniref:AMP-binding protein n=1 Tax=Microbacterium lacus TaxID=415217 RepID=UPI000C2BF92B|nr:AMP-binding protein [Microbacterium lacus]|tara:strand:- start:690 stop:1751 length:1062 start_codon:yes stop_codon:yes gene_type:complete